ncbi:hypothetical protein [Micromonospora rubida]
MEPITLMILAALLTKVVTTHREDMEYARHGQESPRYKMKMAKLAAAQKAGQSGGKPPVRAGASGYMQELWRDSWDDLTEHRRRTRQARKDDAQQQAQQEQESLREWSKRSLNKRPDGRPVDDMLDVAGVRPGIPEAGGSIPQPPAAPTSAVPPASRKPRPGKTAQPRQEASDPPIPTDPAYYRRPRGPLVACGQCNTSVATNYRIPRTIRGVTVQVCLACAERIDGGDLTVPADMVQHSEVGCTVCGQHRDAPWCEHRKAAYAQFQHAVNGVLNAGDPPADDDPAKCNRCPYGRITGTRPWPGSEGSSADADQLCNRCGWLSHHMSGKTWDQHLADLDARRTTADTIPHRRHVGIPADTTASDETPDNVIPLFPNAKELDMTNGSDTTGLMTAIAYADAAAQALTSFTTSGSEGYTAALARFKVGDGCVGLAVQAQEAAGNAAAMWTAHAESLRGQLTLRDAYAANPDAGDKDFVTGE